VDSLDDLALTADDEHHLAASLRLRPGAELTASDGRGNWRACRFGNPLQAAGDVIAVARPQPELLIGFALIKGARPELVVQKLTELGVDRIVPFVASRSVVRIEPDRAEKQLARLRRVAREAAMQSRRVWLPQVDAPIEFADVARLDGVVRCDAAGRKLRPGDSRLLIGPEGGWSDAEREAVPDAVALSPHVLRAETAAIAAGALTAGLRGGTIGAV